MPIYLRYFIGSRFICGSWQQSFLIKYLKLNLTGRNSRVYATMKHIFYRENYTILNDIDSKRSSSCCCQGNNSHPRVNKLTSFFYASVLLLIMNFLITLPK